MVKAIDIAKAAGVSLSTVSQTFNNPNRVGKSNRDRVLEAAEKLGYKKPKKRKKVEGLIGLLIGKTIESSLINPFYSYVIKGILDGISQYNFSMTLEVIDEEDIVFPRVVREGLVDGLVLLGRVKEEYVKLLTSKSIPFVLVDYFIPKVHVNCVVSDGRDGGYQAGAYITKCGHKNIGLITSAMDCPVLNEREEGFIYVLKEKKIKVNPKNVVRVNLPEYESGIKAMEKLLKSKTKPTAVFCVNDLLAYGAIRAVEENGLKVPKDISVMGYDNIEVSLHTSIYKKTLTTIDVKKEEMGRKSVEILKSIVEEPERELSKTTIPTELIIRDTVKVVSSHKK